MYKRIYENCAFAPHSIHSTKFLTFVLQQYFLKWNSNSLPITY